MGSIPASSEYPDPRAYIRERKEAKAKRALWILTAVVIVLCALPPLGFLVILGVFSYPTNERDNANPETRKQMISLTLEWGQLTPFPKTARDFVIRSEGNSFTRTFAGSFTDSPEAVVEWLKKSPGVIQGEKETMTDGSTTYVLKMGGGANYGTVTVSPDGRSVAFRTAWN